MSYTIVIQCSEFSDHDCPYIITDAKVKPFEPRYKIARSMKDFDQQHYKETLFASNETSLPFTAIFAVNDPEDQFEIFNDFIIKHLEEQTPMKRMRIPRQLASWIRELDIVS